MNRTTVTAWVVVLIGCLILASGLNAQDDAAKKAAMQEKVAAFKQSMAENQKALQQYTWTETTQLSLKGEVKSTKTEQCSYGPDGKVQKTPVSAPPEQSQQSEKKSGRRGGGALKAKVVEKKKDEMKDYMEKVAALIHQYAPPPPELIKADVAGGKASATPMTGAVQLQFKDFVKPGDLVSITVDQALKLIREFKVDSYVDKEDEKVALTVGYQTLPDGTSYAATKTLDVAAKKIVVTITGSNYQKLAK